MAETLSQPDPDSWKIFIATSIERSTKLTLIKVYVVFAKKCSTASPDRNANNSFVLTGVIGCEVSYVVNYLNLCLSGVYKKTTPT